MFNSFSPQNERLIKRDSITRAKNESKLEVQPVEGQFQSLGSKTFLSPVENDLEYTYLSEYKVAHRYDGKIIELIPSNVGDVIRGV